MEFKNKKKNFINEDFDKFLMIIEKTITDNGHKVRPTIYLDQKNLQH